MCWPHMCWAPADVISGISSNCMLCLQLRSILAEDESGETTESSICVHTQSPGIAPAASTKPISTIQSQRRHRCSAVEPVRMQPRSSVKCPHHVVKSRPTNAASQSMPCTRERFSHSDGISQRCHPPLTCASSAPALPGARFHP